MGVEERKGGMFARPQKILLDGREDSITMVCMISACLWEGGCVGPLEYKSKVPEEQEPSRVPAEHPGLHLGEQIQIRFQS